MNPISETKIGELRQYIAIQANTPTRATSGQEVASWATISGGNCWAKIETRKLQGEVRSGDSMEANEQAVFVMRYRTDVTTKHRIVWNSRNFNVIEATDPEYRGRWLQVICMEQK